MKPGIRTYVNFFQAFAAELHESVALVAYPVAMKAAVTAAPTMTTLGGAFAATAYHYALPAAVLFTMAGCRIIAGLSDLRASFVYEEHELQKSAVGNNNFSHCYRLSLTARQRLRYQALYAELTAIPLVYCGVGALHAGSFSAAFGLGCMGLGAMAAMDCLEQLFHLIEDRNLPLAQRGAALLSCVCKGIEAAGWFMLMSNPVLGASFLAIGYLYKMAYAPTLAGNICTDLSTTKQVLFSSSPSLKTEGNYPNGYAPRTLGR